MTPASDPEGLTTGSLSRANSLDSSHGTDEASTACRALSKPPKPMVTGGMRALAPEVETSESVSIASHATAVVVVVTPALLATAHASVST